MPGSWALKEAGSLLSLLKKQSEIPLITKLQMPHKSLLREAMTLLSRICLPPMYARVWKQQSMDRPGETNLISPSALYSRSVLPFFPASFICSCTFSCSKFRRKKPYDRRICLEKFQKLSKFCAGLLPCLLKAASFPWRTARMRMFWECVPCR